MAKKNKLECRLNQAMPSIAPIEILLQLDMGEQSIDFDQIFIAMKSMSTEIKFIPPLEHMLFKCILKTCSGMLRW